MKNSVALHTFHFASKKVPAYQKLLKNSGIDPIKIRTLKDFVTLPIIDKRNYIYSNALEDLFPNRNIPPMVYASSGSSGIPTFWFRGNEQEQIGGKIHEKIFHDIFQIKKKDKTLVVVCFAMGLWIAGNYTLAACRYIANKGYNITTITPGIELEDILHILSRLAPRFSKLVLAGYPPFLMDVVSEARRRKIIIQNDINIITAGDKFPEVWRTDFLDFLHITNPYNNLISIYGSADAGVLGHETPLSIFIRRQAAKNHDFSKILFGEYIDLPALLQYNPKFIAFEEIRGELILTANTASPLVRYNIHDSGNILSYKDMEQLLADAHLLKEAQRYELEKWKLPFLVLRGRTDVSTTFYALNILPEHIRIGLDNKKLRRFLSGNFFVYNKTVNKSKDQKLYIKVELNPGIQPNRQLYTLVQESIVHGLLQWNMEFRKLYSTIGGRALPIVTLHRQRDSLLQSRSQRSGIIYIKGRKPKILLSE